MVLQKLLWFFFWSSILAGSTTAFSGSSTRSSVSVLRPLSRSSPSITVAKLQQQPQLQPHCFSSTITRLYSNAVGAVPASATTGGDDDDGLNKMDRILSKLTSGFPLWVIGAAIMALVKPGTLSWVNKGQTIETMLASVMIGMGMTLEKKDFTAVFADNNWSAVPFGVLCQFGIMPIAAGLVGRAFLLPLDPSLYLGLVLVGCSPGGTASNLVSLIAGANVALSVLLTACSTFLAAALTPLLVKSLVGGTTIMVSGKALCLATAKVVLGPVLIGMGLNAKLPELSKAASRFTPFASVLLVAIICGGVMASNASAVFSLMGGQFLPRILGAVVLLHSIGFACGYGLPKSRNYKESTARTISIETGMQNSALAVVLAQSIGAPPLAALPGAISALTHSCLGSLLAAFWRIRDRKEISPGDDGVVDAVVDSRKIRDPNDDSGGKYGVDDQGFIFKV